MSEPALAVDSPEPIQPEPRLHAVPSPPLPQLQIPAYDLAASLRLERELGVGHVLAQVLVRRGLADPAAALEFLEPQGGHPASAFAGMDRAVAVIERHI